MVRKLLIGIGILVVILLGAFWWLMISSAKATASAPGVMDIAAWRTLIAADTGKGPDRLGFLEIGSENFPSYAVQAGRFSDPVAMSFNSVELAWPDRTIIIDSAVDAESMEEMSRSPAAQFDPVAYETLLAAMTRANLILLTHEHFDHVMGIARHPDPAAIAPRLALTEIQRDAMAAFTRSGDLPTEFREIQTLDLRKPVRIAPGVVVAAMAGHTAGTEVIFVERSDGREYLFIGDIAWNMSNIEDLTTRPLLLNFLFFDPPEERTRIRAQLRALHDLMQAEPGLTVVPSHDRAHLQSLVADGRLADGFVPAR
jgi:glyoxylase-like metal-dependent hydrolase (beta-lactamase superfamily II)